VTNFVVLDRILLEEVIREMRIWRAHLMRNRNLVNVAVRKKSEFNSME
jgi:hypothetical protein